MNGSLGMSTGIPQEPVIGGVGSGGCGDDSDGGGDQDGSGGGLRGMFEKVAATI